MCVSLPTNIKVIKVSSIFSCPALPVFSVAPNATFYTFLAYLQKNTYLCTQEQNKNKTTLKEH